MAKQPSISNLAARNAVDEITVLLDEAGGDEGRIRIYDGTQPADVDTPITSQVLLAELQLSNPAFGAAVDNNPGALALGNAISDDTFANASGTASWFRCLTKSGIAVIDGSIGSTSSFDMIVDSLSIVVGQTVQVISFKYSMAETSS